MRIGYNPHRDEQQEKSDYFHQVVIPVYIPNFEDYFKDSFEILQLCLNSLLKTVHKKTYITIVNNGSSVKILNYLDDLLEKNQINELIHTNNIGKLNAILKGISGHQFDLVTIADADVMFLNNWQNATYKVFDSFPKAGAICPTPSSKSLRMYTSNIYWNYFFSKKIKFSDVENKNALINFANSVGDENFYNVEQLNQYLTITSNETKAVVGGGHFVATYRFDIFDNLNYKYTQYKLGGDSEKNILDFPVIKKGFWRLSTSDNYAYHMGNVKEDWMDEAFAKIIQNNKNVSFELQKIKPESKFSYFIKSKLFGKFILTKKIMRLFLMWKGLTKQEAQNYI